MTWKFGRQTPDSALMRFVARNFSPPANFLDIGSGEGANARELTFRGYEVMTVDQDVETDAQMHVDIRRLYSDRYFDCIFDINTLCHVEDPPFEQIKGWLRPKGIFFSICPSYVCTKRAAEGKDFTRFSYLSDIRQMLNMFNDVRIHWRSEPDFLGGILDSWIVEARP